jgi:hypothetical protein
MIMWDAPAAEVWTVVEKAAEEWERKQKQWRARGGKSGCGKSGCGKAECGDCDDCPGECPMQKGRGKRDEGKLRDDEF